MELMIDRDHKLIRELKVILGREISLHQQYSKVLAEEQKALTKFETEKLTEVSARRLRLTEQMEALQFRRLEIVRKFIPESEEGPVPLSKWIEKYCHPQDITKLRPIVKQLRELAEANRQALQKVGCILEYSHNLVASTASIIRSGGQEVTDTYSQYGKVYKHYLPNTTHGASRQA